MSKRPFINKRIDVLEQLFAGAANQLAFLRLLEEELRHRTKPRAVALRRKVKSAITRANGGIDPGSDDGPLFNGAGANPDVEDEAGIADDNGGVVGPIDQEVSDSVQSDGAFVDIGDLTDGEIEASEPIDNLQLS